MDYIRSLAKEGDTIIVHCPLCQVVSFNLEKCTYCQGKIPFGAYTVLLKKNGQTVNVTGLQENNTPRYTYQPLHSLPSRVIESPRISDCGSHSQQQSAECDELVYQFMSSTVNLSSVSQLNQSAKMKSNQDKMDAVEVYDFMQRTVNVIIQLKTVEANADELHHFKMMADELLYKEGWIEKLFPPKSAQNMSSEKTDEEIPCTSAQETKDLNLENMCIFFHITRELYIQKMLRKKVSDFRGPTAKERGSLEQEFDKPFVFNVADLFKVVKFSCIPIYSSQKKDEEEKERFAKLCGRVKDYKVQADKVRKRRCFNPDNEKDMTEFIKDAELDKILPKDSAVKEICVYPHPPGRSEYALTLKDLKLLFPLKWMNDNIINYYLQYLLHIKYSLQKHYVTIFSTYFYPSLLSFLFPTRTRSRRFGAKGNIFLKKFIIIPVNVNNEHWILFFVCYPCHINMNIDKYQLKKDPKASSVHEIEDASSNLKSQPCVCEKYKNTIADCAETKKPCILVFDSLDLRSFSGPMFSHFRNYLKFEWQRRYGMKLNAEVTFSAENIPGYFVECPQQLNKSDCGVFLMHFVELFLKNPQALQVLPPDLKDWFDPEEILEKRFNLIEFFIQEVKVQKAEKEQLKSKMQEKKMNVEGKEMNYEEKEINAGGKIKINVEQKKINVEKENKLYIDEMKMEVEEEKKLYIDEIKMEVEEENKNNEEENKVHYGGEEAHVVKLITEEIMPSANEHRMQSVPSDVPLIQQENVLVVNPTVQYNNDDDDDDIIICD